MGHHPELAPVGIVDSPSECRLAVSFVSGFGSPWSPPALPQIQCHDALFLNEQSFYVLPSELSPSEIAPQFATWDIVLNRLTIMFIGITFLTLAAGLHPRIAGKPTRNQMVTSGICALTVAVLAVAGLVTSKVSDQYQVRHWASVHHGHRVHSETDIDSIKGIVDIHSGRVVHLDLSISIAPTGANGDQWLLSLNPGYKLSHISVDGEVISDYQFENGLLTIPASATSDVSSKVHLVASGVPDPLFAYLDTSLDPSTLHPAEFRRLLRLGRESYIFHSQYFAMMPGVSWFPASGSACGRGTLESRPTDYLTWTLKSRSQGIGL